MSEQTQLAIPRDSAIIIASHQMTPADMVGKLQLMQDVMKACMKKDIHFGEIPGTGKPTLLLPGAQMLSMMFRLRPTYKTVEREYPGFHREYVITCQLHTPDGALIGEGLGSCSTLESKYRYRKHFKFEITDHGVPESYWQLRGNPKEQQRIIRNIVDDQNPDNRYSVKKIEGEGYKIIRLTGARGEEADQIEHPNPPDFWNTVLKIAKKRCLVDAVLTATAATDIFTQDVEDMKDNDAAASEATGAPIDSDAAGQTPPAKRGKGGKGNAKETPPADPPQDGQAEYKGSAKAEVAPWPAARGPVPTRWQDNYIHFKSSFGQKPLGELKLADLINVKKEWIDQKKHWEGKPRTLQIEILKQHILEGIAALSPKTPEDDIPMNHASDTDQGKATAAETHAADLKQRQMIALAEMLAGIIMDHGITEEEYFAEMAKRDQLPKGAKWTRLDDVSSLEFLQFATTKAVEFLQTTLGLKPATAQAETPPAAQSDPPPTDPPPAEKAEKKAAPKAVRKALDAKAKAKGGKAK